MRAVAACPEHMGAYTEIAADQLQQIHGTAVRILVEVGIALDHAEMRRTLLSRGCLERGGRLCIPARRIEESLRSTPRQFDVFGRDANRSIRPGDGRVYAMNAGVFPNLFDRNTGQLRRSTLQDVGDAARVLDAMDNVDALFVSLVDATDVPPQRAMADCFASTLRHTTKPLIGPGVTNRAEAQVAVALARAVRDDDPSELRRFPVCSPFVCPISPLRFPHDIVEAMMIVAQAGLPVHVITNPILGLTAPHTIAGALALGHAEVLAAIVMVQCIAPGLGVMNQNTPSVPNMTDLASTSGGPDSALIRSTAARLYRHLGLPCHANAQTDAPLLDVQAASEKAIQSLCIAFARPSLLGGIGALANGTAASFEAILLDNERIGAIRRILEGVTVDEEHLAFDVVRDSAAGRDFVTHEHTLQFIRSTETWRPGLSVHRAGAGRTLPPESNVERARAEAARVLGSHQAAPVAPLEERRIGEVLASL